MVEQLDANLACYADCIEQALGKQVRTDRGRVLPVAWAPPWWACSAAELQPGIQIVIDALKLAEAVADADLVITGEGRIDSQTIHGKTPMGRTLRQAVSANR